MAIGNRWLISLIAFDTMLMLVRACTGEDRMSNIMMALFDDSEIASLVKRMELLPSGSPPAEELILDSISSP